MNTVAVTGADLSTAWLAACRAMSRTAPAAYHTVVRIHDPVTEDHRIRTRIDEIFAAADLQPVDTVAGTIFPAAIAATSRDHLELTRRYLTMLPTLKRLARTNSRGTYFSRLIHFPGPEGPVNQLDAIITRLRSETANKGFRSGPLTACYEAGFTAPGDGDAAAALALPVRAPGPDTGILMGFPCLSHCSFQLDRSGTLHAMAHYRSHYMVEKAYGNYLGLGQLLNYVATQAGLMTGELTVTAGYARLDHRRRLSALLTDPALAAA
jgi:hypothetical protein